MSNKVSTIKDKTAAIDKILAKYESIFGKRCFFRIFKDNEHCYVSFPFHKEFLQGITLKQAFERATMLCKQG